MNLQNCWGAKSKQMYLSLTPAQCRYPPAPARLSGLLKRRNSHLREQEKCFYHLQRGRITVMI